MKKTITKLSLNKSTISNLNNFDMSQMVGGKKSDIYCGPPASVPTACAPSGGVSKCSTRRNCPPIWK